MFQIHPRILTDCHRLGRLSTSHLLLNRDSSVHWFLLVPETECENLLDMPRADRDGVLDDCTRVSDFLSQHLRYPRINVAWLGNVVSQLHVHVVGRRPDDVCWPKPVWGNLGEPVAYSADALESIRRDAVDMLGLRA